MSQETNHNGSTRWRLKVSLCRWTLGPCHLSGGCSGNFITCSSYYLNVKTNYNLLTFTPTCSRLPAPPNPSMKTFFLQIKPTQKVRKWIFIERDTERWTAWGAIFSPPALKQEIKLKWVPSLLLCDEPWAGKRSVRSLKGNTFKFGGLQLNECLRSQWP